MNDSLTTWYVAAEEATVGLFIAPGPDWSSPSIAGSDELADAGRPDVTAGTATVTVPIASLRAGDSPRLEGENLKHAEALAQVEAVLPPILVHRQTMRVIDGMHRWRAAQLRGDRTVKVQFFDGDAYGAFVAAVRANVAHGLPLTLADREAAAERILGWQPQWSDRSIGAVTGLAAGTVGTIRRRVHCAAPEETARIGRDGRVRPLNPAEGRLKARDEIMNHPEASLREIARAAGVSPATAKDVRDRLRRGIDPVPSETRQHHQPAPRLEGRGEPDGATEGARTDLASSLQKLGRDPSVRYTDSGRTLLRHLELQASLVGRIEGLVAALPPHCGFLIADVARLCARKWQAFAVALESELEDQQQ
jgi:hypothetical protein